MPGKISPKAHRSHETRTALVEAAIASMITEGKPASMEKIARAAGVSKGGLLYHFPSQESLALGMCEYSTARLREHVEALVDAREPEGRLHRAYVRALTGDSPEASMVIMHFGVLWYFRDIPTVAAALDADAQWWREALARDGVPAELSATVRFAAEGVASSMDGPYLTEAERGAVRTHLLVALDSIA